MSFSKLKSFSQRVKENAAKQVEAESKAAANPELKKLQDQLAAANKALKAHEVKVQQLEKERAELHQFRELTQKERVTQAINSELVATAKKLNVKDSALEDVVGLLAGKFQYTPEGKVLPTLPEGSEPLETEAFVSQWLENKSHFVSPPAAQPAGIKPAPQGAKPISPPAGDITTKLDRIVGTGALFKK